MEINRSMNKGYLKKGQSRMALPILVPAQHVKSWPSHDEKST